MARADRRRIKALSEESVDTLEIHRRVGANIKAARMRAGLTQRALAAMTGGSRSYLFTIEAGTRRLSLSVIAQIAAALNVPIQELVKPPSDSGGEPEIQSSGVVQPKPGMLAIELPAGVAFEAGMAAARSLGRALQLIDPLTREIRGIVR